MTPLFLCQLLCIVLMPLSLITGQGLFIPVLAVIVFLLRRQMILEQQVAYLLQQDTLSEMKKAVAKQGHGLASVERVKGL